jgi:hypothetical protein
MKNIILFLSILFLSNLSAQKFKSLDISPMDMVFSPNPELSARIIYSRPQLKGRDMGKLAPNGKIWRTGANESTELELFNDANINGNFVKKGKYSIFTIPGNDEWTFILNSKLFTWGAYGYDSSNDVLRIKIKSSNSNQSIEALSIAMEDNDNGFDMYMAWGTMRLKIPFTK